MFRVTEVNDPEHGPSLRIEHGGPTDDFGSFQTIHCGADLAPIMREALEEAYGAGLQDGAAAVAEPTHEVITFAEVQPGMCVADMPDELGQSLTWCRWPEPDKSGDDTGCVEVPTEKFCESSLQPKPDEHVTVLARGLSAALCSWILSTTDAVGDFSAKRARHLAAGGTVENYPGDVEA